MSLVKIGNESWDLIGDVGREVHLPTMQGGSGVTWPTRWRIFGPLQEVAEWKGLQRIEDNGHTFTPDKLTAIPKRLVINGETLEGRDVALEGDTLDIGKTLGGYDESAFLFRDHFVGKQAYAFAELELSEETELTFGAGADYWMQWWLDGQCVLDTLKGGNDAHPPSRADHIFSGRLSAGKHLVVVRVISGQSSWLVKAGIPTPREQMLADVAAGDGWHFMTDLDEIRSPKRGLSHWHHSMAVAADRCLAEETIECEFQLTDPEGNVGLLLGAQDSDHYYWVQIPRWGQLWRARGFWVNICKADGSGYLRNLKQQLMPNVVCHCNSWHTLKVSRRGQQIQAWVDDVKGPCITDDTYGPGRVGIAGFAKYTVRNLKIDGTIVDGPAWTPGDHRKQPWFNIDPDPALGDAQAWISGPLLKTSDKEIITGITTGRDASSQQFNKDNSAVHLYRSRDCGRSWARYGTAKDGIPGIWLAAAPGLLRTVQVGQGVFSWTYRDSTDQGQTWSQPMDCELLGDWRRDILQDHTWNWVVGHIRLNDGTLMNVIVHGYNDLATMIPNRGQGTWGGEVAQPYCTLSTDQGRSWSQPVAMDNAAINDGGRPDSPCGGFSETPIAQLPSGRIVATSRPFASPFMWQTHSDDGGKTWRMACYAPFSGAGAPELIATRSGYLVSIKRASGIELHISTDGGVNWDEGTMIDFPSSFNGTAIEVEPDILLVVYPEAMDEVRPSYMRAQRIRITPQGPEPLPAE